MEGQGVRIPAMEPNATDSTVDESPGVDATGHEATSRKRPDLVLDREGASNRSSDTGPEDPSLEGKPERSGPEELARAPKEGNPRPSLRIRPAREDTRGRDGAGTGARPPPPGVTQDEPQGNQGVRGTPRPGAYASGPRPAHPPARAGRPARRGGNPSLGRTRRARPFEEWPAKVNDERSGVATPGAPASAGTSKVRRAGGLRGPHANASGPASEGRARRQLQARTEESGGATDSITTRTEDRATGPSE
jgi:hypothetical protein